MSDNFFLFIGAPPLSTPWRRRRWWIDLTIWSWHGQIKNSSWGGYLARDFYVIVAVTLMTVGRGYYLCVSWRCIRTPCRTGLLQPSIWTWLDNPLIIKPWHSSVGLPDDSRQIPGGNQRWTCTDVHLSRALELEHPFIKASGSTDAINRASSMGIRDADSMNPFFVKTKQSKHFEKDPKTMFGNNLWKTVIMNNY